MTDKDVKPMLNPYVHECADRPHLVCSACAWAEAARVKREQERERIANETRTCDVHNDGVARGG